MFPAVSESMQESKEQTSFRFRASGKRDFAMNHREEDYQKFTGWETPLVVGGEKREK